MLRHSRDGQALASRDTAQGEKRRFYKHNFDLGAAAKLVSRQETLNWRAFCVGGQSTPTAAKGGNAQWRTAIHPRDGGLRFTGEIFFEAPSNYAGEGRPM